MSLPWFSQVPMVVKQGGAPDDRGQSAGSTVGRVGRQPDPRNSSTYDDELGRQEVAPLLATVDEWLTVLAVYQQLMG